MRDFGAAPGIDRLVVVPYDAQVAVPLGQGFDDAILAAVRVLVLIDQEMVESRCFLTADVGKPFEQLFGQQQQVVEIDRTGGLQRSLIAAVAHSG